MKSEISSASSWQKRRFCAESLVFETPFFSTVLASGLIFLICVRKIEKYQQNPLGQFPTNSLKSQ